MRNLILLTVATVTIVAGRQEASYDLIWHPQQNAVITYKLQLDIDSLPDKFSFISSLKTKVLKVKPNGDYDIETDIKGSHIKHGIHDDPLTDESKPTVDTFNRRGEKIATSEDSDPTDDTNPGLNTLDSITDELTPKTPVHIGETWTTNLQPNAKLKRVAGKVSYTLTGTEKQGRYQTLKITFKYTEMEKDVPLVADGYVLVNQQDFSLVRFEGTLKGAKFSTDPDFPNGDATLSVNRD